MTNNQTKVAVLLESFYKHPIARVSVELFLTIGFTLFLGIFAIQPTLITMTKLTEEIKQKKALDEQLTRKVAALSSAQVEYFKIQDKLVLLDQAFPSQIDVVYLAKVLEKTANESSVIIQSLSISKIPQDDSIDITKVKLEPQDLALSVTIEGSYASIRGYVENLRKYRTSILVNSVVFSIKNNRGKERLLASLNVSVPYYGAPLPKDK